MFRKLCKYEFRSTVRTLAPIYLAVIAVSIVNALMGFGSMSQSYYTSALAGVGIWSSFLDIIQAVSMFAYFGVMVALSVLTLIVIIQRFYKGLLCDEGYLMFTLPVKPWQLIAAKGTAAFVMAIASCLVAMFSILILVLGAVGPVELFSEFARLWSTLVHELSAAAPFWPLYLVELFVVGIVSGLASLYQIYLSMAIGHLAGKHRIAVSVVAYVATSTVLNIVSGFGMVILGKVPYIRQLILRMTSLPFAQWGNAMFNLMFAGMLAVSLIQLALFFFGTERILSKKLNLE